jgi:hypothetical protein
MAFIIRGTIPLAESLRERAGYFTAHRQCPLSEAEGAAFAGNGPLV